MAWGTRGRTLPRDWSRRRALTRDRANGRCEWTDEHGRCPEPGTDCDHVGDRDDHRLSNLRWLCRWHHNIHTAAQSAEARALVDAKRWHPVEPHPGRL